MTCRLLPSLLFLAAAATLVGAPASATDGEGGLRDFSFVAVPIPVSNPALGNGLAVAALGLYKVGDTERPWTSGVGGFYTDSASWAGAALQKAYIAQDRFRVMGAAGLGDFNIDFFGIGERANSRRRSVPIKEQAKGGLFQGLMRVSPNLYGGVHYRLLDVQTTIDLSQTPFADLAVPQAQLDVATSMLGLAFEYDTRDSEYGPTRGWYATSTVLRGAKALGGSFDYTRAELAVNRYQALAGGVLAMRASACRSGEDAPFFDLCAFGSQSDLRGYTYGEFLDHAMYAVQAEYRRHIFWKFGAVAFAGVGSTAPSFKRLTTDNLLPAGGVGVRYEASGRYRVNLRLDYAWGKGSEAFYFTIGEAF